MGQAGCAPEQAQIGGAEKRLKAVNQEIKRPGFSQHPLRKLLIWLLQAWSGSLGVGQGVAPEAAPGRLTEGASIPGVGLNPWMAAVPAM